MKNRFSLYASLAAGALLLAACSSDDEMRGVANKADNEISVSTYITATGTRALTKTAFANGDAFGLSAHEHEGSFPGVAASLMTKILAAIKANATTPENIEPAIRTTTFMFNETVTLDGGNWTYSPIKKWPDSESTRLSFFAVYPRPTSDMLSRMAAAQQKLGFDYTISTTSAEQQDIMWCSVVDAHRNDRNGAYINGAADAAAFTPTSGALPLKFCHALSKVAFKARAVVDANGGTDVTITSLSVDNVKSKGQMIFADNLSDISWSGLSTPASYPIVSTTAVALGTTATNLETMLLIPQTLASDACITLSYTYMFNGQKHDITKTFSLADTQWAANTAYTYQLTINPTSDNITVSADINNWEEAEVVNK